MIPAQVKVVEPSTSTVPLLTPSDIPLFEFKVKVDELFKVPPFKVKCPAVDEFGAAPNPESAEILIIPAVIEVAPVNVFSPDKVSVPDPAFVHNPAPDIIPETVSFPESPVVKVIELANATAPEPLTDWIVSVASTS